MQINSLGSMVSSAYDAARSNLRSMADAAAESGRPEPVKPALAETPRPEVKAATEPAKPVPGQRQGVNLDSYA
ncbi:MAG: hypothetical protein SYR96_06075 [Actinomycetota bacterium]|nr:hypothetical protein [Actinomycetota bacterium]